MYWISSNLSTDFPPFPLSARLISVLYSLYYKKKPYPQPWIFITKPYISVRYRRAATLMQQLFCMFVLSEFYEDFCVFSFLRFCPDPVAQPMAEFFAEI